MACPGQAAFEQRLEGLGRSFTPPLVPPSNLRTSGGSDQRSKQPANTTGDEATAGPEGGAAGGGGAGGGCGEDIDLLYDPILSCYYDPKTNKYYELRA